ncbi:MAG: tRNA (pseudouridine(54)-N(1))-methyltransferase TrmY [Candidatus Bipolaricaulota bacterium]|nr:tRNA (pseudouridine(54)-N(1))-methyltransferase TrmY [Candidatus Bipolaricaulota bacterium]MCS7275234.1 tRNA (pseudouridine(54)-N(1))-methyltransferase TrmY [Candidatus Bipolaricaulota bacterium]MDW8111064.1 tRNA (pseudouridine(54)-N(1))-methyltransferase TrmY [Candidatus Bipolaricaulota bacterium]MDW8329565.1 tRNA (pseudouridine(54)-N(1))-methyltransferase TrmY [Candidatus Bipolaricaulota bacterium]
MRSFIVLGHRAALTPDFSLNDLPGSAGRLDILCRCVTAAFCLSHGIRRDVTVYLVLQNQIVIRLEGARLKHLNPDERSTGALLQKALKAHQEHPKSEIESTPGIFIYQGTLSDVLARVRERVYVLHEAGRPITELDLPQDVAFVLSDHLDFQPDEEALFNDYARLSLGPLSLHADHCVAIVHNHLDRAQFANRTLLV